MPGYEMLDTQLELNIKDYTMHGRLSGVNFSNCLMRLLLTDIGFEAGFKLSRLDPSADTDPAETMYYFQFEGDVVRAACWLRHFELVVTFPDGRSAPVAVPREIQVALAGENRPVRKFGEIAFAGRSWFFENRLAFAEDNHGTLPGHDSLPVFGLLGAAFGDTMWLDENARPSAKNILDRIPKVFLAMIIRDKMNLLIDISNEGRPLLEFWIELLHCELQRRNIPGRRCILLQQNIMLENQYNSWISLQKFEPMRIMAYDYYPRRMIGYLANLPASCEISENTRPKYFTCLNYTPRPNRTSLASWLIGHSFDDKGHVSFGKLKDIKNVVDGTEIHDWFPDIAVIRQGLEVLRQRAPLIVDLDPSRDHPPEFDLGPDYVYNDTYFSIVTETELSDGDLIRITEKSIKPLAMYHPIIILGNPHSLAQLEQLGFKTFPDFFDETYDTVSDPKLRVKLAMDEIRAKLNMKISDLHRLYWDNWAIIAHNASHARRVLNTQYQFLIEPKLMERMTAKEACDMRSRRGNGSRR